MSRFTLRSRLGGVAALAVAASLALSGCTSSGGQSAAGGGASANGKQLLTIPREDMGTFTRNFNPFSPNVAPMTQQAIYESLLVYNPAKGNTVPWLGTKWTPAADGKSITFTLRDGVTWSDGEPFTAADVVYTFELQKKLLGGYDYLAKVVAKDDHTVVFQFNRAFSPGLYEVGQQIIVPKHVWEKISDPSKDTNPDPVGTGPYTQVANFSSQSYDLLKNPHYWQPAKQKITGIRMLAFAGNDGANLAAVNGDVDWAPQYMPNIQQTYVAKDPEHRHYWFPPTGSDINWQLNTTKAPFDDVDVRKALSMAIDRGAITKIGMSGYTSPADCTGLSGNYDTWRDADVVATCDWTKRDVSAANALLDKAGYAKGSDGKRTLKDGKPFTFKISVGSTSSDWLSVANIIAQNLADVGITAKVDAPDWSAVTSSYEQGTFDTGIVWANNAPTPYQLYRGLMSTTTVKPVGIQTTDNYHRFGDKAADTLLDQFASTGDATTQHTLVDQLQALFAKEAPVIPLFSGPQWGAYTTVRFTGWPTEADPYATLDTRAPTTVLVLTSLTPVTK
ncbi:ABC transporter substrate-binding protein [Luteimicrobium xylanilyticum]|uniref:Nickel-binding periplasmic protein n=1 Tax=Luteimicrobium xylanilyticum TaxID=1133546 RepID=A0A5P9Q8A5_9MICO|nr:ABC transporter substrate-binding protein [Luteimicrobium xylanilyticum]QFU97661.1 Nickel-binding periplasmic protein [Luteimicrobium xylanilyticum]